MQITFFNVLMQLLRDRTVFLNEIEQEKNLDKKIISLLFCSAIFFGLYGAIIGSTHGLLQMISSAFKLPALYLITLIICLPTLYFFDVIFGSKKTFNQYLALLMASMAMISVMLFGFAPVTLFFRLSIDDYNFFRLLNVCVLALTGVIGVKFFHHSMISLMKKEEELGASFNRQKLIKAWLFLYGFVGSQLGWTLRPFFGAPNSSFALFREIQGDFQGNFYAEIINIINSFFGFN